MYFYVRFVVNSNSNIFMTQSCSIDKTENDFMTFYDI